MEINTSEFLIMYYEPDTAREKVSRTYIPNFCLQSASLSYVTAAASILSMDEREAHRGLGPECSASYRTCIAGTVPLISTVIQDECGQREGER